MPINGHGLIAAAGALFSQPSSSHKPDSFDLPPNTTTIQFLNPTKVPLNARRHSLPSWYEIELPASLTSRIPLDSDEGKRLCGVIGRALDRRNDGVEVYIKYIGKGGRGYENYLLVELDKKVDLEACKVDTNVLSETQPYTINVLSSEGPQDEGVAFVSRMFAPTAGLPEDHVCGSAHALLTPYYTSKRRAISNQMPSQPRNLELHAKQVSKRGGDLCVIWDEDKEIVKIAGEVVQTSSGSWVYKSVDKHYPDTYVHEQGWKTSYTW